MAGRLLAQQIVNALIENAAPSLDLKIFVPLVSPIL